MKFDWLKKLQLRGVCALCGDPADDTLDLCQPCRADLPVNLPCCTRCALPLTDAVEGRALLCGRCLKNVPHYDALFAPFRYEPPCDFMITRLKFAEKLYFGRLLGDLLAAHLLHEKILPPDIVTAVPLHDLRFRERGFNQSEIIAKTLSRHLHYRFDAQLLSRTRDTQAQSALPASERKKNVRGAFTVNKSLAGLNIAVVDDVVTTASTVNEIARVLKNAGAERVQIWSFARAAAQGISAMPAKSTYPENP